jgi:AraC family transcriptional regulator
MVASAMLAMQSCEVVRLQLSKFVGQDDEDSEREASLMVSEKNFAAFEAGANWLARASPASIIGRYREHVAANARRGFDTTAINSRRHEGGFRDPLLAEIAYAIMFELEHETAAGRLLAETLALSLVARLIQNHAGASPSGQVTPVVGEGLDRRRLARVLDYIEANLEGDLTVARLVSVACLSQLHFARAFKAVVGQSPHVGARRLERAKELLCDADRALVDIALALRFSCQANFTRVFRRATGQTPAQYRRSLLA